MSANACEAVPPAAGPSLGWTPPVLGGEWYLALGALAVCSKEWGRGQWQGLTREKERWKK